MRATLAQYASFNNNMPAEGAQEPLGRKGCSGVILLSICIELLLNTDNVAHTKVHEMYTFKSAIWIYIMT